MPILPSARGVSPIADGALAEALLARGRSAFQRSDLDGAIAAFRRVLTTGFFRSEALSDLTVALMARGETDNLEEAIQLMDASLAATGPDWSVLHGKGLTLSRLGRFEEASACFAQVMRLAPNLNVGYVYLAKTLALMGRHEEAVAAYDAVPLALAAGDIGIPMMRGVSLEWLGRFEEAEAELDRAIAMNPDDPFGYHNKGLLRLLQGDLPAGYRLMERRWEVFPHRVRRSFATPPWLGETSLEGKTLFVHWEQGLGDTIQFCRYVPMAARAGATVILEPQAPLARLLTTLPGVAQLLPDGAEPPPHDLHCPVMSLPLAFGTTKETIPGDTPYLRAEPDLVAAWRDRLAGIGRPRIGLVWGAGSRLGNAELVSAEILKSVSLAALGPLASVKGAEFVSLQVGPPAAQAATPPDGMVLHDFSAELKDFSDTAALIENLDLTISICTSVAHLAGAMGKPVWLLNRFDTDWRWFLKGETTAWYPSMRIFRQPSIGDWDSVVRAVTAALRDFVGR